MQELRKNKRRPVKAERQGLFAGLVYCADCGSKLHFATCKGFEGNSFRDCTRVAALDVPLWTQLFSLNAPALDAVLEKLGKNLSAYRAVLQSGDRAALSKKLAYSAARKRQMNLE